MTLCPSPNGLSQSQWCHYSSEHMYCFYDQHGFPAPSSLQKSDGCVLQDDNSRQLQPPVDSSYLLPKQRNIPNPCQQEVVTVQNCHPACIHVIFIASLPRSRFNMVRMSKGKEKRIVSECHAGSKKKRCGSGNNINGGRGSDAITIGPCSLIGCACHVFSIWLDMHWILIFHTNLIQQCLVLNRILKLRETLRAAVQTSHHYKNS